MGRTLRPPPKDIQTQSVNAMDAVNHSQKTKSSQSQQPPPQSAAPTQKKPNGTTLWSSIAKTLKKNATPNTPTLTTCTTATSASKKSKQKRTKGVKHEEKSPEG